MPRIKEDKTQALETIKKELIENFNTEIKEELTNEINLYIDKQVSTLIKKELDKSTKKLINHKNRKIIFRDIIIIILFAIIIYLLYILKNVDYFDKYFISNNSTLPVSEVKKDNNDTNKEENTPSLEELKDKYSYLLNNIYLNETSNYINTLYEGNLTKELKQYFILNSIDLTSEDDYNIIDDNIFKNTYNTLFNDEYEPISFNYNDNLIRYISKLDSYISEKLIEKNNTNIIKEIINITETEEDLKITTVEGLKQENKILNILTKEEVCNIKDIKDNKDKLNKLTYVFNKNNKLVDISK